MYRIIIIDPEIETTNTITKYLKAQGHQVVGWAASYEAAKALYQEQEPDLILSEVHLDGLQSGIELAHFIQTQETPKPFVFLTNLVDLPTIHSAKKTCPAGYLTKPVHKHTLLATIEIAMHTYQMQEQEQAMIQINNGKQYFQVAVEDILYLRAEHNYVHIALANAKPVLQRASLREILEQLPADQFLQTHRSFAVNLEKVSRWDGECLYVDSNPIRVSRLRRKEVFGLFSPSQAAS